MIKTALKHYLYEFCINQIFNGLHHNLLVKNNVNHIKVGDHYNCIFTKHDARIRWYSKHFNCIIIEIYNNIIVIECTEIYNYDEKMEITEHQIANIKCPMYKESIIELS